jgi:hypothetical protein
MKVNLVDMTGLTKTEVKAARDAVQAQIDSDFAPAWDGLHGTLRLGKRGGPPDGVLYLQAKADVPGALGYHASEYGKGPAVGFVFMELAQQTGEPWESILSHEALEMLLDPYCNWTTLGPHPKTGRIVGHWGEACDAVQGDLYTVRRRPVSNFVLPDYWRPDAPKSATTNHLGLPLAPFGVRPGGYIGFWDPKTGSDGQVLGRRATKLVRAKARFVTRAKLRRLVAAGV